MWVALLSVTLSAVTTFIITARFRKEVFDYVEDMCDLCSKIAEETKQIAIKNVDDLVKIIIRDKNE